MEINNKDILWRESKKCCIICGGKCESISTNIMGYLICKECIKEINSANVNDNKYDFLKDKISETITKKILKMEDKE